MNFYKPFVVATLALLPSCGAIADRAKEAARDWWVENRTSVVDSVADTAKTFWEQNKDSILDVAKKFATDNKDEALALAGELAKKAAGAALDTAKEHVAEFGKSMKAELMSYTDEKLAEKLADKDREVRAILVGKGVDITQFDTNGDGSVSTEELVKGTQSNPSMLLTGGVPLLTLLLLYWAKQARLKAGPLPVVSQSAIAPPSA